ncbi:DUF3616 domain-containing protein [Accumulibacter sp.]|uniref:DUF3616 domain-containing protein n=1 Tax=Accumulibacter sp. TaxID=2053492 RepID=UPI0025E49532|nr:DUF3616 domain-containing protein [Accumulibacter sp.]MCM8593960.1 DUF3616 domain-containing protein [Accumulibacter sp.]MCM8627809.1 DUF3616 domain-containing protein [Accumulibacter sp.]MDS4048101.1 DUF3616 domain-containing protein [Accumulibacter sp.]
MPADDLPRFLTLTGSYEPSGIRQLPDGAFIVVEDEEEQPFTLLRIGDGAVSCSRLEPMPGVSDDEEFWSLDDLEAVTVDDHGYVWALTSHSRSGSGQTRANRERLLRFRVADGRMLEPALIVGLKEALTAAHPLLADAAKVRDVKARGGLNIEGLERHARLGVLMLGFRSPLIDRQAIIACVENPEALPAGREEPRIARHLWTMNLDGNGIRDIAHVPCLDGYLVIAGPVARERSHFQLWFWSGVAGERTRRVLVPGLPGLERAEGVCPAIIDGRQRIVIVSDDGSRDERRCAHYLVLDPTELRIEPW